MRKNRTNLLVALVAVFSLVVPAVAFASTTPNLTQSINAGTLTTDILDASRVTVGSPTAAMSAKSFSFSCQTSTGTLGTNSERVYVINPSATSTSWTLAINATTPGTGTWTSGGNTYKYNDATGSGCTNGQLTIDPSVATVNNDCTSSSCTSATITKGSSTAMTASTPVTLMSGGANAGVWRGYLTGIGLSQAIPAEQPSGSYTLNMTLTVTGS